MTKSELIAAMASLPDDAKVFFDTDAALIDLTAAVIEEQGDENPAFLVLSRQ